MNDKEKQNLHAAMDEQLQVPVVEEQVHVEKEVVDTGSIRIRKSVDERVVEIPFVSRVQGFDIERTPMDKYVEEPPASIRYEGKTMIISVVEEEVVMVKRLKLIEEIRLTPSEREIATTKQIVLKRENVIIQKNPPGNDDKN